MTKPVRILHVVGRMNRGGVETWLMHVLRNIDRERLTFDFLVHTSESSAYDDEIRSFGGRIIACPGPQRLSYSIRLRRALAQHGPYDVVHSHVHAFSGLVLTVAASLGVPIRIAHSHSTAFSASESLGRRLYLSTSKRLVRTFATRGLAVSGLAAASLFGPNWQSDERWSVQHLGIDITPFRQEVDPRNVRTELGIPCDAFVIGHVGRLDVPKNHNFLLAVAAAAGQHSERVWVLLVGDGPLRTSLEQRARILGIRDRVVFAGIRHDVPRILRAMDVFVMPSLYEGLPLAAIEAQASGLPVIISDAITPEVVVATDRCQTLPLSASADQWAAVLFRHHLQPTSAGVTTIEASSFNLAHGLSRLVEEYIHPGCG